MSQITYIEALGWTIVIVLCVAMADFEFELPADINPSSGYKVRQAGPIAESRPCRLATTQEN
jgi:hypothetical protein